MTVIAVTMAVLIGVVLVGQPDSSAGLFGGLAAIALGIGLLTKELGGTQSMSSDVESPLDGTAGVTRAQALRVAGFHIAGLVLFASWFGIFLMAMLFISFGTSSCFDGTAEDLHDLRVGSLIASVLLAFVPAAWALLGRVCGHLWLPWAVLAVVVLTLGIYGAFSTDATANVCILG